jgi:hypothetical protein
LVLSGLMIVINVCAVCPSCRSSKKWFHWLIDWSYKSTLKNYKKINVLFKTI